MSIADWLFDEFKRAAERQLESPYTKPEAKELAHHLLYPDAVGYGKHATGKVVDSDCVHRGRHWLDIDPFRYQPQPRMTQNFAGEWIFANPAPVRRASPYN